MTLTLEEAKAFTQKNGIDGSRTRPLRGSRTDKPLCFGSSHMAGMVRHYRCDKVGKVTLADGSCWCGIHSPDAVARRAEARAKKSAEADAKNAASFAAYKRRIAREKAFPILLSTLEAIRDGHNDPRTAAAEALANIGDVS